MKKRAPSLTAKYLANLQVRSPAHARATRVSKEQARKACRTSSSRLEWALPLRSPPQGRRDSETQRRVTDDRATLRSRTQVESRTPSRSSCSRAFPKWRRDSSGSMSRRIAFSWSSEYRRTHRPGAMRPALPARWWAELALTNSTLITFELRTWNKKRYDRNAGIIQIYS